MFDASVASGIKLSSMLKLIPATQCTITINTIKKMVFVSLSVHSYPVVDALKISAYFFLAHAAFRCDT